MIATLVFSMVLMVIIYGVLSFTSDYYKGINTSSTQVTAQNAMDTITQAIQFSSGGTSPVTPGSVSAGQNGFFCAGSKAFVYTAGQEYDGSTPGGSAGWGLYTYSYSGAVCPSTPPALGLANGTELLGKNMRVTGASLTPSADWKTWTVTLKIAYGDSDLLCDTSKPAGTTGGCLSTDPQNALSAKVYGDKVVCRLTTGSQFCAVATLSTVAVQRVN